MPSTRPTPEAKLHRRRRYDELSDTLFTCSICRQEKPGADFPFDSWRTNGINKKCRLCTSERIEKDRVIRRVTTDAIKKELTVDGCACCPEKEPCCLEFHHLDPETKTLNFSQAFRRGNLRQIKAELRKGAIVLCSNCHRKVHAGILSLPLPQVG